MTELVTLVDNATNGIIGTIPLPNYDFYYGKAISFNGKIYECTGYYWREVKTAQRVETLRSAYVTLLMPE